MADSSCSHWWHAPFYVAMSVALAVVAISTIIHEEPNNDSTPSLQFTKRGLSLNASRALRSQGFNVMATLLQISPDLFVSSPESTIFAIPDSTVSNISARLPPWAMKQLLQYHTSPSRLPMEELLKKPQESCVSTDVQNKYIKITKVDKENGVIEINNVLISHPDMFLDGHFSVHGVIGSFLPLEFHDHVDKDWSFNIHSDPTCEHFYHGSHVSNDTVTKNFVQWQRIIQFLSTHGFLPFAIGLQYVLDGIIQDYADLSSVTIFAPPYFTFLALPSPLLDRVVRLHVLPQSFTHTELASMPEKSSLKTLLHGENLEIHKCNSSGVLAVDSVEITAVEIFVSKDVIVHGISRALGMEKISGASR